MQTEELIEAVEASNMETEAKAEILELIKEPRMICEETKHSNYSIISCKPMRGEQVNESNKRKS